MLDVLRLNHNPYVSPSANPFRRPPRGSQKIYWALTLSVLACWAIVIGLLFRFTNPTVQDGQIWLHFPGEFVSNSASGDTNAYYDVTFCTTIASGLILVAILIVMSLAVVNGMMLFWRRRGRPT